MNIDVAIRAIAGWLDVEADLDTVQAIRSVFNAVADLQDRSLPPGVEHVAAVPYKTIADTTLTVDIFKPATTRTLPTLVYCHGGAWIAGSPTTHFQLTSRLAQQGFLVFSVDYRLAPEHPFPAAYEDCVEAVEYAVANAHHWQGDPERLVMAGDSAGANLSAAVASHWQNPATPIRALGLLYGVFDFSRFDPDGITGLLVEAYLGSGREALMQDARVSPILRADALPPAHIAVGSADDLLEDSQALRAALARAGNVHEYHVYEDMPHAFSQLDFLDDAGLSIERMAAFLHELAGPAVGC